MSPKRRYGGSSAEERAAARREKLMEAAIRVFSAQGFQGTTVQDVCTAAGLTKRYFYESFADSEALFAACFRNVAATLIGELGQHHTVIPEHGEARARAIILSYFEALRSDPVRAQLFLTGRNGLSAELVASMHEAESDIADLIIVGRAVLETADSARGRLQRLGAASGMARISSIWIEGGFAFAVDEVAASAFALFNGLIEDGFGPPRSQ